MAPIALLVELRIGLDLRRGVVAAPRPGRAAGWRRVVARVGAAGPPLVDPVAAPVICPAEAAVRSRSSKFNAIGQSRLSKFYIVIVRRSSKFH